MQSELSCTAEKGVSALLPQTQHTLTIVYSSVAQSAIVAYTSRLKQLRTTKAIESSSFLIDKAMHIYGFAISVEIVRQTNRAEAI